MVDILVIQLTVDWAIVCWTKVGTGLALDDIGLAQDWNRIGMDFSLLFIVHVGEQLNY